MKWILFSFLISLVETIMALEMSSTQNLQESTFNYVRQVLWGSKSTMAEGKVQLT